MWVRMINLTFVWKLLKGRCYGNQLIWRLFANVEIDLLQPLLRRAETECNIAICIRVLTLEMMQLYLVKIR